MNSRRGSSNRVLIIITLVTISVTGGLFYTTKPDAISSPAQHLSSASSAVRIFLNGDVVGDHPGWNDSSPGPTITVTSGETVTLLLNATDILTHNWFIDTQNNFTPDPNGISSPDFSHSATKVLNYTFTPIIGQNIPSSGNWTYRCKYHPIPYMFGTIRILRPPDFSLTATPTHITTTTSTAATATVKIIPSTSFTGTVDLTAQGSNGLQTMIDPENISNGSGNATLTVTPPGAGNYTATITATSGPLTHSLKVTVQATDFTISADPNSTITKLKSIAISTITIESVNQFTGIVTLATNSTLCTLNPITITGAGTDTLSCSFTSTGRFAIQITGSNGLLSHSLVVIYNVTKSGHVKNPKHH